MSKNLPLSTPLLSTLLCLCILPVQAQLYTQSDTFKTPSNGHMFLNVRVPSAEFHLASSRACGSSYSKLCSNSSAASQEVKTIAQPNGNMEQFVVLNLAGTPELRPKSLASAPGMNRALAPGTPGQPNNRAMYCLDPAVATDLNFFIESGSSRLDLSGLSLSNANIHTTFADLYVTYSAPNRVRMKKMDIHAASGDITLKNPELANAEVILIHSDMGDVKIHIDNSRTSYSNIILKNGIGSSFVMINPNHPVRLVMRTSFLVKADIDPAFQKVGDNIYENALFTQSKKGTTIICDADAGTVSVMTNAQK